MLHAIPVAGGGFLLAVLWFDLMFDVQVRGHAGVLPEPVLDSICAYYRRVTTSARPMGHLVAVVMLVTLVAVGMQFARGVVPAWISAASLAAGGGPMVLALLRTVPNAMRLGARRGTPAEQSALARSVFRDHLLCLAGVLAFLALQLGASWR